jgi:hypothetical protein
MLVLRLVPDRTPPRAFWAIVTYDHSGNATHYLALIDLASGQILEAHGNP